MHPLPSSTIIFQFLPHPPREIRSSNPFGTLLPPLERLIRSRRGGEIVAPSPPALRGAWWSAVTSPEPVRWRKGRATLRYASVERGGPITHCPTFHPLPSPPLLLSLSLAEYFFPEDYVASIRVGSAESNPCCLVFFFFYFPSFEFFKSHASALSVNSKIWNQGDESKAWKVEGRRNFGLKILDWSWMFRVLEFLERIGWRVEIIEALFLWCSVCLL